MRPILLSNSHRSISSALAFGARYFTDWVAFWACVPLTNDDSHCIIVSKVFVIAIRHSSFFLFHRLVGTLVLAMLSIFSSLGIAAVSGAMATWPRFRSYNSKYNNRYRIETIYVHQHMFVFRSNVAGIGVDSIGVEWTGVLCQPVCLCFRFSSHLQTAAR